MVYNEVKMDVLNVPHGWAIAHCISADKALGAGVAKQIENTYGMKRQLELFGPEDLTVGTCYICMDVINMVTKAHYWDKPTMESMELTLGYMRRLVEKCGIKKIAMPKIGCGLDRLTWDKVKPLIQSTFYDMDVEIMVCYL